jgi:hypothetical protein
MTVHRARVHAFGWLAILAIAALALAPTVSRLLASPLATAGWAVVCGPGGVRAVGAAPVDRDAGGTLVHLESCAYCGPAFGGLAPLPPAPSWQSGASLPEALAIGVATPSVVFAAWPTALPRAPPARA